MRQYYSIEEQLYDIYLFLGINCPSIFSMKEEDLERIETFISSMFMWKPFPNISQLVPYHILSKTYII